MIFIETERLRLRNAVSSDAEDVFRLMNSEFIQRYNVMQAMDFDSFLERFRNEVGDDRCIYFGLKEKDTVIGHIDVDKDQLRFNANSVGISYWLDESCSRKGYMSEALSAIIDHVFQNPDIELISSRVFAPNAASINLLKKLGFTHEGTLRHAVRGYQDIIFDDVLFSLFRSEWNAR